MTPAQQAAYVFAQSISALIEAFGMLSDNMERMGKGESAAWVGSTFNDLVVKYSISHNDVMKLYQQ